MVGLLIIGSLLKGLQSHFKGLLVPLHPGLEGDFNCTMDKMDRVGGNKTQRLYRYGSKFVLSKPIVDNGLWDLWKMENQDSSEFTHYNKYSGIRSRIDRVYIDIKIANNTKINHIMVSFADHYDASIRTKTSRRR